jgi:hypothetical protein
MVGRSELSEAVSIGGELLVANLAVGVSVMVGRSELSEAVSIGGELQLGSRSLRDGRT